MWINLSAEQERQIRELVRASGRAHWEADCELPGWGLTINICSLDTWVEIDVDNSVHDIGSACVDFGTIFDEDNPRLAACRTCLSQNSLLAAGLGKLHLASANMCRFALLFGGSRAFPLVSGHLDGFRA